MVRGVRAGTLRHRIELRRATTAADAGGTIVPTWPGTLLATVWASFKQVGGGESQQAGQTEAKARVEFTMRYYSGLVETDRLIYDSRTFKITSIDDVDGMNVKHIVETVEVK